MSTASSTWLSHAVQTLTELERSQTEAIDAGSRACADAIAAGRLVHTFGAGHSRIPVEEMFPRYGSYPAFHPLVELSLTHHTQVVGTNGQRQAMYLESVSGFAEIILSNFDIRPPDVVIVFSASGLRAVPVEMAVSARERGAIVVAVTSVAQSRAGEPVNAAGSRLFEVADIVIDLCTPAADAVVEFEGIATIGPTTSLAAVAVANMIKVSTYQFLLERGVQLPVITSATAVGAKRSAELFDAAYREYAHRLARLLSAGGQESEPTE